MSPSQDKSTSSRRSNKRSRDDFESPTPQPRSIRPRLAPMLPGIASFTSIAHQMTVGSFPLTDAHLPIPASLPAEEIFRRKEICYAESKIQTANPPVLPLSRIPKLPEKPFPEDFAIIPPDATPEIRERLEKVNQERGLHNDQIDRQRNNQAATKSRAQRLESLDDAQAMLLEKTVECYWLRLRLGCEGIEANKAWEAVPKIVKDGIRAQISREMGRVEKEREVARKAEEARVRKARAQARSARRKAAGSATTTVRPKSTLPAARR